MKKIITILNKAEYFFRPSQLYKRLKTANFKTEPVEATLPWGHKILVSPEEDIGKAILVLGLYDITVSEVIMRLCDPAGNEPRVVLDVGANIGYMTSVLSHSLNKKDTIISFEPHPQVFSKLELNSESWSSGPNIKLEKLALSNVEAELDLMVPINFSFNEGLGFLATPLTRDKMKDAIICQKVNARTLDLYWSEQNIPKDHIFLMKIDTEGNELLVLQGAQELLKSKKITNIIFEEHLLYPAPSMLFLEKMV